MGCLVCIRRLLAAEAGEQPGLQQGHSGGQHGFVEVELRMMVGAARLAPRMR